MPRDILKYHLIKPLTCSSWSLGSFMYSSFVFCSLVSLGMEIHLTTISTLVFLPSPILVLFCYEKIVWYRKLEQKAGITAFQLRRKVHAKNLPVC